MGLEPTRLYEVFEQQKKEEVGWKSPFEIFYGRKSNELLHDGKSSEDFDVEIVSTKLPTQSEYLNKQNRQKTGEMDQKKVMSEWPSLMVEKHASKNIYKADNPGEKVFVRIGKKRGKFVKRDTALAGTAKKNIKTIPT